MSRRLALAALALAGAAAAAPAPLAPLKSGLARGKNLLVVTLDTTRADRLGCYGDARAETPSLDRLAAQALRFTEAVSVAPVTLVAHASLFTGTYPTTHGVRHNAEYRLRPEAATLAEGLSAAGYDTAAFVSAFVLDERYGLDQGSARYDDRVETARGGAFPAGTNERRADRTTDDLDPGADRDAARGAIAAIGPAIELADLDQPPEDVEAILAGNIYQRHVVLGPRDATRASCVLDGLAATVVRNGEVSARTADPQALTGDYLDIVRHVASLLADCRRENARRGAHHHRLRRAAALCNSR